MLNILKFILMPITFPLFILSLILMLILIPLIDIKHNDKTQR